MDTLEDAGLAAEWAARKGAEVLERIADATGNTDTTLTSIAVQLFDDRMIRTVNPQHRETFLAKRRLPTDTYNAIISLADQVEAEARQMAQKFYGDDDPGGYAIVVECLSVELVAACALCRECERGGKQVLGILVGTVALAGGALAAFAFLENRKRKRRQQGDIKK